MKKIVIGMTLLGISICAILMLCFGLDSTPNPSVSQAFEPVHLATRPLSLIDVDAETVDWIERQIQVDKGVGNQSLSNVLHVLMYHGLGSTSLKGSYSNGRDLFDAIFDKRESRMLFGDYPFKNTPFGLRVLSASVETNAKGGQNESHRDQFLAFFSMQGIHIKSRRLSENQQYVLSEILKDLVANFSFDQGEIAWSIIALAGQLESKSWTNRFNKSFCFDDVVEKVSKMDVGNESCGGTHVLMALLYLYESNKSRSLLSASGNQLCRKLLESSLSKLLKSQRSDGAWDAQWNAVSTTSPIENGTNEKTILTSHVCEFLLLLPPELFNRSCRERLYAGSRWLLQIAQSKYKTERFVLCPRAHVFTVLRDVCY